eukprot:853203-Alexandrium_andersonii.AAC.2
MELEAEEKEKREERLRAVRDRAQQDRAARNVCQPMPGTASDSLWIGGLRIGASSRFRDPRPPRGLLSWADSESTRKAPRSARLRSFGGPF